MSTNPLFRTDIETRQVLPKKAAFTRTLSSNNSETVIDLTAYMQEAVKLSLIVDLNDVYINLDSTATASASSDGTVHSILIPSGSGYTEDNIFIASSITAINASAGNNGRIRGIVWGR